MKILITGSTGFVGKNLIDYFKKDYVFLPIKSNEDSKNKVYDIVINLAGKAHDIKNSFSNEEYYHVNTHLARNLFDSFIKSEAKVFITLSSVKAAADSIDSILFEENLPNPKTHYGKSKLLAEQYILSKLIPEGKRVFILRPCLIHGPGNKGNLNTLYNFVSKDFPWPLGAFENKRSYCSVENLMFILRELIEREDIPSGVYNVADDEPLSTNDVISALAISQKRKAKIFNFPKPLIRLLAKLGDLLKLPLTTEKLQKLTESYVVSNQKILTAIGKPLPVSAKDGLLKTFNSYHKSDK